jgi:hypothetical protein
MNSPGLREFSSFNTGKVPVFEAAQVYSGIEVSPILAFLSSDATLIIGKRGGAHPIISEIYTTHTSFVFYTLRLPVGHCTRRKDSITIFL